MVWQTVDFAPAATGITAWWIRDGHLYRDRVVGWMTQQNGHNRRVIAATLDYRSGIAHPVDHWSGLFKVLPSDSRFQPDDIAEIRSRTGEFDDLDDVDAIAYDWWKQAQA